MSRMTTRGQHYEEYSNEITRRRRHAKPQASTLEIARCQAPYSLQGIGPHGRNMPELQLDEAAAHGMSLLWLL